MSKTEKLKANPIKPSLILCSDFHLRENTPPCRTDDFWSAQWEKLDFISELQKKYDCPVFHAGDLFHHWKPSPYLLSKTMRHLPQMFASVAGNHDLPNHRLDAIEKSGLQTLKEAGVLRIFETGHCGTTPPQTNRFFDAIHKRIVLIWHIHTWKDKETFPGCKDLYSDAKTLLKKYPNYDLIITGDNHKTFVEEYKGRILVNPGSLTRQTADQADHKPCIFLWYAESNEVEQIFLPIKKEVISREHIDKVDERNERISAFVERLQTEWTAELSFEKNMEIFAKQNKIDKEVMNIIYNAMEVAK